MDVIEGNFLLMSESYEKYIQLFFHPQIRKKCVYIYIYIYIYMLNMYIIDFSFFFINWNFMYIIIILTIFFILR